MRTIEISVEVFAKIWASRQSGEASEDAILRRLLLVDADAAHRASSVSPAPSGSGYIDERFGVSLPQGFRIFRNYKGRDYAAVAENGRWRREDNGERYSSLNGLSRSVGARTENAWRAWLYADDTGPPRSIGSLRNSERVLNRVPGNDQKEPQMQKSSRTWVDLLVLVLTELGGRSRLSAIYETAIRYRLSEGASVPRTLDAVIRRTLENHSSDSHNYLGGPDLFCMPEGKGQGVWALR
jgi:hypothetical protein